MAGSQRMGKGNGRTTVPSDHEANPQYEVLWQAFTKYQERSEQYIGDDPYGNGGYRAQIVEMQKKLDRLWIHFNDEDISNHDKIEDDAIDLINYVVFFLRLLREGNRDGSWPWPN
jgi:hypothetical protein